MRVEALSINEYKIYLSDKEIDFIFGSYNLIGYTSKPEKAAMNSLLKIALPSDVYPLDCKKILLEVKPRHNGCCIYFKKVYSEEPTESNSENKSETILLRFKNSEDMIQAACELYRRKIGETSELYFLSNEYYLLLHNISDIKSIHKITKKYQKSISDDTLKIEGIKEYGNSVCKENAVYKIGSAFLS